MTDIHRNRNRLSRVVIRNPRKQSSSSSTTQTDITCWGKQNHYIRERKTNNNYITTMIRKNVANWMA